MKIYGKVELGISMVYIIVQLKAIAKKPEKTALELLESFAKLAAENNFGVIEVATLPPFDAWVLEKVKREIKRKISPFETIYHLPFGEINIASIHPDVRKASIAEIKSLIDLADELEIKKIVMHPGFFSPVIIPATVPLMKSFAKESIFEIYDFTKERGMQLALENLDYLEALFKRPEEFRPFVKEGIGICLDTVHAMRSGINPLEFIKMFGKKIVEIHLTDGIEGTVWHSAIGSGKVNCLEVLSEYVKSNKGEIVLELTFKKDIQESLKFLKENRVLFP